MHAAIPFNKNPHSWYIIAAVMLSTVMEILDSTIVNVSLPHMMGSLSADRDEISWVLTSYIVASSVLMPLTGFLVNRIGCKRLMLINVIGFMVASALCGIAATLFQIVFFRLLQGVFGASLVPLSQFILRDTFPNEDQPKVMAMWGIGVMAAPILGPTIGGYITDVLNWRWVFFINVPICIINFFLVMAFIKETELKKITVDWKGMLLIVISVGCLQLFLDRGQTDNWFSSSFICFLFSSFVLTFAYFIYHAFTTEHCIINLRLFRDRNFAFGTLIISFFAASIFGSLSLMPQMLETLFGYTSSLSGIAMAPRGIASGVMMGVAAKLMTKNVDARILIFSGLAVTTVSVWIMSNLSLDTNFGYLIMLGFVQGFGIGLLFMPLTAVVYSTLKRHEMAEAAGLFNFGRNIGSAIGISFLITFLDRDTQTNWHILGSHLTPTNGNLTRWLAEHHLSSNDPHVISMLGHLVNTQSNFIAYAHTYRVCATLLMLAILFVFMLKTPKFKSAGLDAMH